MKTLIKALIIVPVALVIILLSVANRAPVVLSLDPFSTPGPLYAFTVPLFVIALGAVILGVLMGGFVVWWSQRRYRRALRHQTYELERIKAMMARQNQVSGFPPQAYSDKKAMVLPARVNI